MRTQTWQPKTVEDSSTAFTGLMQHFMASMTAAIATAITTAPMNAANIAAAATTAVQTLPKAVTPSSLSIDSFDNLLKEMDMREGKALWYTITRMPSAWPKAGVVVTVANTESLW